MIGIFGMVSGLAVVAGPVLGGVLVDTLGWRTIFLVNLLIGAVTMWLGGRSVLETSNGEQSELLGH